MAQMMRKVKQNKPVNAVYSPMVHSGTQLEEVQIEGRAVGWTHWVG